METFEQNILKECLKETEEKMKSSMEKTINEKKEDFSNTFLDFIINTLRVDYQMTLESKLNFTQVVISNRIHLDLTSLDEFFEEECHLTILNWIYKNLNLFKLNKVDEKLFHLLNNIIIIYEIIPIKVADLLDLKIYEKFNKIRKLIEHKNNYIYRQIDRLLNYWTDFCADNCVFRNGLGRKRQREDQQNGHEHEDKLQEENVNLNDFIIKNKNIKLNKNKKVIWDENLTKIKLFNKEQSPNEIREENISNKKVKVEENSY